MRHLPWLPTHREFIRARRRDIRVAKRSLSKLRLGCACEDIYRDEWRNFYKAINMMGKALEEMDRITKPFA